MTARKAFVLLLLLTLALVGLTVAAHYVPLPLSGPAPAASPVIAPVPDEPTLMTSLPAASPARVRRAA